MNTKQIPLSTLAVALALAACGGEETTPPTGPGPLVVPDTYAFQSRFGADSSVSYGGQIARHVLLTELTGFIGGMTDQMFANAQAGDVSSACEFFYDFANRGGEAARSLPITAGLPLKQTSYGELSSVRSLREKMPDLDAGFDRGVVGWGDDSLRPDAVARAMFAELDALVLARTSSGAPNDPNGSPIARPFVSPDGVDYQQLIQKFLGTAVAYSQAADDYLDDDKDGKGLRSDNVKQVDGQPYTDLEHAWDEGFGYFGAARDFGAYSDDELAGAGGRPDWQGAHDSDGDGRIDLLSEFNFGHSTNAAKRDRGSKEATDFTAQAWAAFRRGRAIISHAGGALDAEQTAALAAARDEAIGAWERALASTVVHYANEVLGDLGRFGTPDYDFAGHAKHWSELKGFALGLQFNPNHSPLGAEDHRVLQAAIGLRPLLPGASATEVADAKAALVAARDRLGRVYGFAAANLGDADGHGGW